MFYSIRSHSWHCIGATGYGSFYFGPVVDGKFVQELPDQAFKAGRPRCSTHYRPQRIRRCDFQQYVSDHTGRTGRRCPSPLPIRRPRVLLAPVRALPPFRVQLNLLPAPNLVRRFHHQLSNLPDSFSSRRTQLKLVSHFQDDICSRYATARCDPAVSSQQRYQLDIWRQQCNTGRDLDLLLDQFRCYTRSQPHETFQCSVLAKLHQ